VYFVYVLQSLNRKRFYIGVTTELRRREKEHNDGFTKSTKPFRPWLMIYSEPYTDKRVAYSREYFLKHKEGFKSKRCILEKYAKQINYGGVA